MTYIVETNQLTKKFGKEKVVNELNLKIKEGEIFGFLGPNGAGKTTTIRMLLGLMKPTSGNIEVFGKLFKQEKIEILKQIGSLVESPSYYPHLTAYENLEVIRKIYRVPPQRINEVLSIVKLTDVANKKVKGFSLGMKQRLGIAASMLHQPKLLILDEPTNGLDPSGIIEMRELIKSLPEKYGMTVIISSHLLSEIDQMATSVGVISKGNLIFQDSISNMREISQAKIKISCSEVEKAYKTLQALHIPSEIQDQQLLLVGQTRNEDIAQVVSTLVYREHQIYRVEEEKSSLEEIFLGMTKEGNAL